MSATTGAILKPTPRRFQNRRELTFAYSDEAAQYIYDRWRLLDPDVMTMHTTGLFAPFVGHSYVGLTPYTALLRVKATYRREGWPSYAGHAFVGKTHVGEQTERVKDVGEAIFKSRSLRDRLVHDSDLSPFEHQRLEL